MCIRDRPNTTGEPNKQGFDYFYGFLNQRRAHSYFPEYLWENNKKVILEGNEDQKKTQYTHDLFAEKTMSFLDKNHKSPFFLYLPLCIPHGKYEIPDNGIYSNKEGWTEKQKIYAAMVSKMDETVGRILDRLKKLGIEENTYIFFTSDNGAAEVENDWKFFESSGIYRGMKRDPYEGGIRVPLLIKPANYSGEARNIAEPIIGHDFYPTLLSMAGIEIEKNIVLDGVDLSPLIHKNKPLEREDLFWHYPHYGNQGGDPSSIIREGKWKLIKYWETGFYELYDLNKDIGERDDIILDNPRIATDLIKKLDQWLEATQAKIPVVDPMHDPKKEREWLEGYKLKLKEKLEEKRSFMLDKEYVPNKDWWGTAAKD